MMQIDFERATGAIFSDDEKHRYALWRFWHNNKKPLLFIGLNPSTANQIANDPTITRLMSRASREGYGGLLVGNLYSYVSNNPYTLLGNENSVNAETDNYLRQMIGISSCVLCGWGSFTAAKERAGVVLGMVTSPYCLGVNHDGQPKHPLYVPYNVGLKQYRGAA